MEENCMVKSGIFRLLNELTDNQDVIMSDNDTKSLSKLAWTGFKILAKRCVAWDPRPQPLMKDYGLAHGRSTSVMERQISKLLSNHLTQAVKCSHKSISIEAVQEALSLLLDLSATNLGKGKMWS